MPLGRASLTAACFNRCHIQLCALTAIQWCEGREDLGTQGFPTLFACPQQAETFTQDGLLGLLLPTGKGLLHELGEFWWKRVNDHQHVLAGEMFAFA